MNLEDEGPPIVELQYGRQARLDADWARPCKRNKDGSIAVTEANLAILLADHPGLRGVFGFDDWRCQSVFLKPPPWRRSSRSPEITDVDASEANVWIQTESGTGMSFKADTVGRGIELQAQRNRIDSFKAWADALVWDGRLRIDSWLIDHLGCADTAAVRMFGRKWLVSVAARAYWPGSKVDTVLVLAGDQASFKTTTLRELGSPAWTLIETIRPDDRDGKMACGGRLLWVDDEGVVFRPVFTAQAKAFFTKQEDTYRIPYGRRPITVPRRTSFAVCLNPGSGGYLTDPTGNRRYLPVTCTKPKPGEDRMSSMRAAREQIWAEAIAAAKAGEEWWGPELDQHISSETSRHEVEDPALDVATRVFAIEVAKYEAAIAEAERGVRSPPEGISLTDIAKDSVTEPEFSRFFRGKDHVLTQKLSEAAKAAGWERRSHGPREKRTRRWFPTEAPQ